MTHSVWKVFFDFEKEEKWLNEMSAKGFAMISSTLFHYTFVDCAPGKYIYRMELLKRGTYNNGKDTDHLIILKDKGIERIDTLRWPGPQWFYFRRKAADGAFEIYSDLDTRIKHYKRTALSLLVSLLLLVVTSGMLFFSLSNPIEVIDLISKGNSGWSFMYFAFLCALTAMIIVALITVGKYMKMIKRLERGREIPE